MKLEFRDRFHGGTVNDPKNLLDRLLSSSTCSLFRSRCRNGSNCLLYSFFLGGLLFLNRLLGGSFLLDDFFFSLLLWSSFLLNCFFVATFFLGAAFLEAFFFTAFFLAIGHFGIKASRIRSSTNHTAAEVEYTPLAALTTLMIAN